jgi:hypothetical protein
MSRRLFCWLVIFAVVAAPPAFSGEARLAGARGLVADDENEDLVEQEQPARRAPDPGMDLSRLVFGDSPQAVAGARGQLEFLLRRKLESVQAVCALTSSQRQRLRLAGFGSIDNLFERVATSSREIQAGQDGPQAMRVRMLESAGPLRAAYHAGPFDDASLFSKILRKTLTAEQVGRYEALCFIERAGGLLSVREEGAQAYLQVHLASTTGTDAGLAQLRRFSNLQFLEVESSAITDDGLAHLRECTALETLDVSGTKVTGPGLAHLTGLTSLHWFDLHGTQVTDDGLPHLKRLFGLITLNLHSTRVTDAGMTDLAALECLEGLNLGQTQLTDAGVAKLNLPGMAVLKELGLSGTGVSDASLAHLKRVTSLKVLDLSRTNVSQAGLAELQESLPGLIIIR